MAINPIAITGMVILDSSAIIAWLDGEPGGAIAQQVLLMHPHRLSMHAVNVCEVLYHFGRSLGVSSLSMIRARIAAAGIEEHTDMDAAFVDAVATLKATIGRVSLGDCCLLALAQRLSGTVVTADRHELDAPGPLAVCPIHFIR